MITSPRKTGSLQYPDSTECIWEIRTDPGYHTEVQRPDICVTVSLQVTFEGRFDLELSTSCSEDYIELQSWSESSQRWVSVGDPLCGRTLPHPLKTPAGHVRLVFRSNRVSLSPNLLRIKRFPSTRLSVGMVSPYGGMSDVGESLIPLRDILCRRIIQQG